MTETWIRYDGVEIPGAISRGGVFAAYDWRLMALQPGPEIAMKAACPRRRKLLGFDEADRGRLTQVLGHYSEVQSIDSEDTVTWSAFGTSRPDAWVNPFLETAFGTRPSVAEWTVALWKTTRHPDGCGRGPEADVVIEAANGSARFVVEAKWLSDIGDRQGAHKDKTQVEMRFFTARTNEVPPDRSGVIVVLPSPKTYLAKDRPVFGRYFDVENGLYHSKVERLAAVTWEQLAELLGGEAKEYLGWRLREAAKRQAEQARSHLSRRSVR